MRSRSSSLDVWTPAAITRRASRRFEPFCPESCDDDRNELDGVSSHYVRTATCTGLVCRPSNMGRRSF